MTGERGARRRLILPVTVALVALWVEVAMAAGLGAATLNSLYTNIKNTVGPEGALIILGVGVALVVSVVAGVLWLITKYLSQAFIFIVPVVCGVVAAIMTHRSGGQPDWDLVIKICVVGLGVAYLAYIYAGVQMALGRAKWLKDERRIGKGSRSEKRGVPKKEKLDVEM